MNPTPDISTEPRLLSPLLAGGPTWAMRHEWLETNGLGGYASGSVLDANTRKYHGMLVIDPKVPAGRHVLLAKMEAAVVIDGHEHALSVNQYPGALHPEGHRYLESFHFDPHPTWVYRVGDAVIRRSVMMPHQQDEILIRFDLESSPRRPIVRLFPLLAYRGFHDLSKENLNMRGRVFEEGRRLKISPYEGMPDLFFESDPSARFYPGPHWHRNIEYLREMERGFDFREDLFCPGMLERRLAPNRPWVIRVCTAPNRMRALRRWESEIERRRMVRQQYAGDPSPLNMLKSRAEQFIVKRPEGGLSIVAGYPWFEQWGRDAMIAAPGLCFSCDRIDEGLSVLKTFASNQKDGLIPNFLGPDGKHAYNSIDATLWFFWAVGEYLERTGDYAIVSRRFGKLMREMLHHLADGKAPHVHLTEQGLLWAGDANTQLTWMDANVHGKPVTPRYGMAVEINALWLHALNVYGRVRAALRRSTDRRLEAIRDQGRNAFADVFWLERNKHLADVVNEHGADASLRPNQLLAASLPIEVLSPKQRAFMVENIRRDLATPYGLRTLSPVNPAYCGRYEGKAEQRDGAYHQGTVWPWWVGHYTAAALAAAPDPAVAAAELSQLFAPLFHEHQGEFGLGSIAEVFDGDAPQFPGGCVAQAWSVAEVIRAQEMIRGVLRR